MIELAFLIAALVLAVTPGPGMAYVVARTVAGGRAEGLASCLGTGLGGLVHVLAASLGLSALIAQSALAFSVLKYLGAAYLVYLGLRLLLHSQAPTTVGGLAVQGPRRALIEGMVVEALNVKTALFFLAFLPQFLRHHEAPMAQLFLMGGICVLLNTAADVVAVFVAHRWLQSGSARSDRAVWLNRASGLTLLGLGAWLALARRQA
jgi:threonine/homoserine/homoserine lactone efflux protein